jgi:SnoaL-like domain
VEVALAVMHPHVDWPDAWEGGRVHGRDAVGAYWRRQFESISSRVEPERFAREDDGAIAVGVHQVVHDAGSGRLLSDTRLVHRWRLEDGLATRMDVVEDQGAGERSSR